MKNIIDTLQDDLLRYPIGKFDVSQMVSPSLLEQSLLDIEALPALVRGAVQGLSDAQLNTPYRPGGWNLRQVVHHLADSHMNAVIRFKLALTEDHPTIKPYQEHLWAELPDSRQEPVEVSLVLLEALHRRWLVLLRAMSAADWQRTYLHPELGTLTLDRVAASYAWHGRHHLAHLQHLRESHKW